MSEGILNLLNINEDKELRLTNPLSTEQDRLRRSLIPNLLKNIEHNQRHISLWQYGAGSDVKKPRGADIIEHRLDTVRLYELGARVGMRRKTE